MSDVSFDTITDRQKFVNPIGGKNMSTHLNEERKLFLIKMMEAYTHDHDSDGRKPEELRHYLLRRNNVLLQVGYALVCLSFLSLNFCRLVKTRRL